MAILQVYETFNQRGAEENADFQTDYERSFDVLTNSLAHTPDTILAAQDPVTLLTIPAHDSMWLPNPTVPRVALCRDRTARQTIENPFQWQVVLRYSTEWQQKGQDPTTWPAQVRGEPVTFREAMAQGYAYTKDDAGNITRSNDLSAVLNSAGDPFDPGPEKDATRYRYTITRWEAQAPDRNAQPYFDTVNAASWRGWDAGCAKYGGASFEGPTFFNGLAFFRASHVVDCRKVPAAVLANTGSVGGTEGWGIYLLDAGYRAIPDNGEPGDPPVRIRDSRSEVAASPAPLNGSGFTAVLLGGKPVPVYLGWAGYPMSNFAPDLDLPEN